jgi:hypothetical protein
VFDGHGVAKCDGLGDRSGGRNVARPNKRKHERGSGEELGPRPVKLEKQWGLDISAESSLNIAFPLLSEALMVAPSNLVGLL